MGANAVFLLQEYDFSPIALAFHEKKKKATILETFRIAVSTNLVLLVIRLTEKKEHLHT